jgi:hypothetical protein
MPVIPGGVRVTGFICPTDSTDIYPTHDSIYGKGGWTVALGTVERDAIPVDRREWGMVVYLSSTGDAYRLQDSGDHNLSNNGNWVLYVGSSGPPGVMGMPGPPGLDVDEPDEPMMIPGPFGPSGPPGPTGPTVAPGYVTQPFLNQTSVTVTHNLGSYPEVQIIDSTLAVLIPLTIVHNSINDFTVTFAVLTSGTIIATMGAGPGGPRGPTGPPGLDADEPDEPIMIPGPSGSVGPVGPSGPTWTPAFQDQAYNAGDFTANGLMTWTVDAGDLICFRYFVVGKLLWISLSVSTSSVGGTLNTDLKIKIPGGYTARNNYSQFSALCTDNGVAVIAGGYVIAGTNQIVINKILAPLNWSASVNATYVSFVTTMEIQ